MIINKLYEERKSVLSILIITIIIITSCLTNLKPFFGEISNEKNTDDRIEYYNYHIKSNGPLTPKGIRLTPINESSNSISAIWYTEEEATYPKIIYSKESSLINNISLVPTSKNLSGTYVYSATLENLDYDQTYYYQISSDSSNEREILNFTTSPYRNANKLKFLIYGDSRTQREPRTELVKKAMNNFNDIDFIIHTGDIVEDGRIQSQWNEYFDDVEILSKQIPGFYIEGNHERLDGIMYDNIPLPSNGENSYYYSFNVGPLNFIGLNTQRDSIIQSTWLEAELNKSSQDDDTLWKIAYMHEPIFNSISTRPDRADLISSWCPLFEEFNMDLVFAGHNHYYERSYPLNHFKEFDDSSNYNFKNPSEPMYFITGGAGAPLYTRDTSPSYTPYYNSTYHFIIIKIDVDDIKEETILNLETWAMPDDYNNIYLIDNMTIIKKGAFVKIHSPIENQLFGKDAPSFNVTIDKVNLRSSWCNLNTTWYNIEGYEKNITYKGDIGTINQTAWESLPDGTITINFYANNSIGDTFSNTIIVHKDSIAPNITILWPIENYIFNSTAPSFIVIIRDDNLDSMWYTITNGVGNIAKKEILIFKSISKSSGKENSAILILVVIIGLVINLSFILGFISLIYIEERKRDKI